MQRLRAMKLIYSAHLKNRLRLRNIRDDLPKEIVETAVDRYFDSETAYFIAAKTVTLYEKLREVMVAYVAEKDYIKVITIHPLKEGQKDNRLRSGRWVKVHEGI